jgi:hypothetical protein
MNAHYESDDDDDDDDDIHIIGRRQNDQSRYDGDTAAYGPHEDIIYHERSPVETIRIPPPTRERLVSYSLDRANSLRDIPSRAAHIGDTPTRDAPNRRKSQRRTTADNDSGGHRESRKVFEPLESSGYIFSEPIQAYYQTGEGLGDVESLLPVNSDDEGPRRLSSLPIIDGACPHGSGRRRRRRRRFKVASKPLPEGAQSRQCQCGKGGTPKIIK